MLAVLELPSLRHPGMNETPIVRLSPYSRFWYSGSSANGMIMLTSQVEAYGSVVPVS